MTRFIACLCSLVFASALLASYPYSAYSHGYRNTYGYTYDGYTGYWRWPADNTYWRYDRYSNHYIQVYPYPAPAANVKNYKEVIAESLARRQAHDDFMEALKLAYPDYVAKPHSAQVGSTLYGVGSTKIEIGALYSPLDLTLLMQQFLRGQEYTAQVFGVVAEGTQQVVGQAIESNRQVAHEVAKGVADRLRLEAVQPPRIQIERKFQVGSAKGFGEMPEVVDPPKLKAQDFKGLDQSCVACHSGTTIKSGFDVTKFDSLPLDRRVTIVREHIMGTGPKSMPRDQAGKHAPLPDALQMQWLMRATRKG